MKIIQVLDEVSKKNFSIASIVKIIDNYEPGPNDEEGYYDGDEPSEYDDS